MKKLENKVGEVFVTNSGLVIEIIEFNSVRDCSIKFEDGTILHNKLYKDVKKGSVKNPNAPSVFNIGYIGEGNYKPILFDKCTKVYKVWQAMLSRSYSTKVCLKYPSYKDCTVCKEWLNFQNFAEWFNEHYIEDFELDKDVLVKGNKTYSPETCCFIPHRINSLTLNVKNKRGLYPIGVSKQRNKYQALITIHKQRKYIGIYDNPVLAFNAYKEYKETYIKSVANEFKDLLTPIVYNILMNYVVEITD